MTRFVDGRALVTDFGGGASLVDTAGRTIKRFEEIESAMNASSGVFPVRTKNGKWGYLEPTGEWLHKPAFSDVEPMVNGGAAVDGGSKVLLRDGTVVGVKRAP